jgi:toxin ParE1/3/4
MPSFRLSVKAEEDLVEIYTYGIFQFGYTQANKYVLGLEETLTKLAQSPFMGKRSDLVSKGLRSFVYKSHLIFYQLEDKGILIVRILNQSRDYDYFL